MGLVDGGRVVVGLCRLYVGAVANVSGCRGACTAIRLGAALATSLSSLCSPWLFLLMVCVLSLRRLVRRSILRVAYLSRRCGTKPSWGPRLHLDLP